MAAATGLTIIKRFTYRGDNTEEFSNQYWFTGTTPSDSTAWTALFDALVAQEKTLYDSTVTVVRGYGYATDNPADSSVFAHDLGGSPVAGTLSTGSAFKAPGDAAFWVRWKTSRTNNGKAIYLRKYFHGACHTGAGDGDTIYAAQKTAALAFGTKLMDGSFLDARTITARGQSDTILSRDASSYLTTRTLKRRGKRPVPTPG